MEVPELVKNLYEVLSSIPPEFDRAQELLAAYQPTEEELMWVAVELTEHTMCEYSDMRSGVFPDMIPGYLHRDYLYDATAFLLEHGLNPNTVINEGSMFDADNAMFQLKFTDGPDVAARVIRLYMEHGGDPNLYIRENYGETLLSCIEYDIYEFGDYEKPDDENLVQCVIVLQAYGGGWRGKDKKFHTPFTMREGYSSEIFKEFEKFDYRFGKEKGHPGDIHVFEKATGKTVADYV